MACLSFLHQWKGCKCAKCGATRDQDHVLYGCVCSNCNKTYHDYTKTNHICSRCGKVNPDRGVHVFKTNELFVSLICYCTECRQYIHLWDGCKCEACGEERDEEHDWEGCRCRKCGLVAHKSGKNCKCIHCGIEFHEIKKDCRCENCHQYIHKWNQQGECACGMKQELLPHWNLILELIAASDRIYQTRDMGVHPSQEDSARVKNIGEVLSQMGGRKLMGEVKGYLDMRRPNHAMFLSQMWDKVGGWTFNEAMW